MTCHQIKAEHQRPSSTLQLLSIPVYTLDELRIYFASGFSKTSSGQECAWVIVDRFSKLVHFIPIQTTYSIDRLVKLYVKEIFRLYRILSKIVSDKNTLFTLTL